MSRLRSARRVCLAFMYLHLDEKWLAWQEQHREETLVQQFRKRGSLGRGRSGTSAQSFVLCVFLCSEVISPCKSHSNFFQKLPLQCRHFQENPLAKKPKTELLIIVAF